MPQDELVELAAITVYQREMSHTNWEFENELIKELYRENARVILLATTPQVQAKALYRLARNMDAMSRHPSAVSLDHRTIKEMIRIIIQEAHEIQTYGMDVGADMVREAVGVDRHETQHIARKMGEVIYISHPEQCPARVTLRPLSHCAYNQASKYMDEGDWEGYGTIPVYVYISTEGKLTPKMKAEVNHHD